MQLFHWHAGGFIALWITGTTLNVSSMIGLLAHFGLSVQKGLILVEYVNQLRSEGRSLREALYIGAHTRMRPVLMTATSAGLGVLPIAIGWGAGAESQQPMAIALIGGLITSTILTLIALPALYELTEGIQVLWQRRRGPGRAFSTAHGAEQADSRSTSEKAGRAWSAPPDVCTHG